jgi:prepilin-type N-terminal cleavage/methylation domain-containing protein
MRTRTSDRGMTLIEILLALIVMALGFLGILALFPPAMESAKESMEETNAAIVGESVLQALTNGMRLAVIDPASKQTIVSLTCDLQAGAGTKMKYRFTLPKITGSNPPWYHFPSTPSAPDRDPGMVQSMNYMPENDPCLFHLGGDGWVAQTTQTVQNINDPTDSYGQFAFSFDIRKCYTLEYLVGKPNPQKNNQPYTPTDLDPLMKLYEFRIYIFRTAQQLNSMATGGGGGGGTQVTPPPGPGGGTDVRSLISVISKQISAP